MFHQRNQMPEADVARGKRQAANQETIIRRYFEDHPEVRLTPPEVLERLFSALGGCPLTSVRRALTDLTEQGVLTKHTDDQKPGPYGMRNCTWGLAKVEVHQETLWGEE